MIIEIVNVDRSKVILISQDTLGYQGSFRTDSLVGEAIFVPYERCEEKLYSGAKISVETSQESVSQFEVLQAASQCSIKAFATPCDYQVIAEVEMLWDDGLAMVRSCGFDFWLDTDDTQGIDIAVGQTVAFKLHQLSLYDENII
jgi:hypothetical protein